MSTRKLIPETVVEGKRLGRHINHDDASRAYVAEMASAVASVTHDAIGLPLDQGDVGSCTANSVMGFLNAKPNVPAHGPWTERGALRLYKRETEDEGQPWPANDPGGSGLAVCKAAVELGMIHSYRHAFSVDDALKALVLRPVITGVNWYTSFDTPDANGMVVKSFDATVRGGHEFVAVGIDAAKELVWFCNSWGLQYGVPYGNIPGGCFCMPWTTWAGLLSEEGDVTVPIK